MKSGAIGVIIGGLAVLLAGFGVGFYYLGGQPKGQQTAQSLQSGTDVPGTMQQSPTAPSIVKHPPAAAGEFTAPGAPNIAIDETPVTSAKPVVKPAAAKKVDSEASETGLPTKTTAGAGTTTGGSAQTDPNTAIAESTPDVSDGSNPAPTPGTDDSQASPNPTPASGSGQGQDGSQPGNYSPSSQPVTTTRPSPNVLYHVQAGAFQSQRNAKVLENALQSKGYAAMTVHQFQGGRDNYVVQVGAYSSAVTADQMVGNLQRDGFPASVSRGM